MKFEKDKIMPGFKLKNVLLAIGIKLSTTWCYVIFALVISRFMVNTNNVQAS